MDLSLVCLLHSFCRLRKVEQLNQYQTFDPDLPSTFQQPNFEALKNTSLSVLEINLLISFRKVHKDLDFLYQNYGMDFLMHIIRKQCNPLTTHLISNHNLYLTIPQDSYKVVFLPLKKLQMFMNLTGDLDLSHQF